MPDRPVVVWGNCQAEPIARLLSEPLRRHGLEVVVVPPVFLVDEPGLAHVQELVSRAAVLITQPVRDEYRIAGCGANQLAALLPPDGRCLTFPVIYHVGAFPFQVNAHGGDGERVDAPLTDYHDLRALVAAARGMGVDEAIAWWPVPCGDAVRRSSEESLARLRAREADLDVPSSDLVDDPGAMFTLSHPSNGVLAAVARRVLSALEVVDEIEVPAREFLGARRAPLEPAVVEALGWPIEAVRPDWVIDRRVVPRPEVVGAHLELYRRRPDIPTDARTRFAERLSALGVAD